MEDFRSYAPYPETIRRRRAPNELVWTQPRTISPSMHKNSRKASKVGEDTSTKDSKQRQQFQQPKHQKRSQSTTPNQEKGALEWNSADLLDLVNGDAGRTGDLSTDEQSTNQNPPITLSTTSLPVSQSVDQQTYSMDVDADFIGSLTSTLVDSSIDDHQSYIQATLDSTSDTTRLSGFSAIHLAAHFGKVSVIRLLLSACPEEVDLLNNNAETPLHIAAAQGNLEVVMELLQSGANTLLQDLEGRTPLSIAISAGHVGIVRLLLEESNGQGLLCQPDYTGKTPLHQAVLKGCDQVIQLLLENGADPRTPIYK